MKTAEISAHYVDRMGTDLTVVNAARASFDKESDWDWDGVERSLVGLPKFEVFNGAGHKRVLKPADVNLIGFLARGYRTGEWDKLADTFLLAESRSQVQAMLKTFKNKAQHWAPFGHPHLQLRMTLPVFLARQYVKHQVGGVWSEVSRRYIDEEPWFWFPKEWHTRPEDVKQGSGDVIHLDDFAWRTQDSMDGYTGANEPWHPGAAVEVALNSYLGLIKRGVAPEEARIVLPLNHMTTVVWTGSLLFWSRVVNQRVDGHAQRAAEELGRLISGIVQPHFPVSWAALTTPH